MKKPVMEKEIITELVSAYGWLPIDSNNQYMISFQREEKTGRMNFYFTAGTMSVQYPYLEQIKPQWFKKIFTPERFEEILMNLK